MRQVAKCYDPGRESIVVSRQSVVSVRLAGLERAQRFAGESFGHEELTGMAGTGFRVSQQARLFWGFAGAATCLALAVIILH